jgi:hypothetical protein
MRDLGIGVSLICGPLAVVGVAGHFEEPLIAGLMLLAADRVFRGKDTSGALWLATASGFKLWGFLGVGILLMNGSPSAWVRRGAIYTAACAACYLPFFLWGSVNTFHWVWPVWPSSTLGYFISGHAFTFQLRLVQSTLVCVFTAALALRLRSNPWSVPVMVVAVRLLFDPEQIPYYWVALVLCLSVGAWARLPRSTKLLWPLTTGGAFLALTIPYLVGSTALRAIHTLALGLLVAALFMIARRTAVAASRPG